MGLVGQLLALILAGYVFTVASNLSRYWFMRKRGYELLFMILLAGWAMHYLMALCSPALQWLLEACGVTFSDEEVSGVVRARLTTIGGILVAMLLALPWNNIATTAGGLATSEFPGRHGRTVIQWAEGS